MNSFDEMPKEMTPNLPLWSFQLQRNSKLALKNRKDLEVRLITKCYEDNNFKKRLLSTPKSVIEEELAIALPKTLEVNVIDQSENTNTIYMVLPCNPYEGISEEDLKESLGMNYEDVAEWCLEQQNCVVLDLQNSPKIIARAWKDSEFKQRLISDFESVIQKNLNVKIPEESQFCILEEASDCCYIVLPKLTDIFTKAADIPMPEDAENALVIAVGSEVACSSTCGVTCLLITVARERPGDNQ